MGHHQKIVLPIHGNEERVAKIIAELVRQGVGFKAEQDNGVRRTEDLIVVEFTGSY